MRSYETTFIVNPQSDDAAIDRQVQSVVDLIKKNNGEIIHQNRMGTRRMAFEIEGLTQGYYTSLIFKSGTDVLPLLERHYKLEEPFIRYLTIKYEGNIEKMLAHESTPESTEAAPAAEPKAAATAETAEEKPADTDAGKSAETDQKDDKTQE